MSSYLAAHVELSPRARVANLCFGDNCYACEHSYVRVAIMTPSAASSHGYDRCDCHARADSLLRCVRRDSENMNAEAVEA